MANQKIEFNLTIIEGLAQIGCSQKSIAQICGCSLTTFKKALREDSQLQEAYKRGQSRKEIELRQDLHKAAKQGNTAILKLLAETELGLKEGTFVNINTSRCKTNHEKMEKIYKEVEKGKLSLEAAEKLINMRKTIDNQQIEDISNRLTEVQEKVDG